MDEIQGAFFCSQYHFDHRIRRAGGGGGGNKDISRDVAFP